ncbi:MAG: poly(3-hydroxybutyrate) depolymerase [Myxococcota bacterium]|jgi:poly(3-hydroxybutyrate) depolymerase
MFQRALITLLLVACGGKDSGDPSDTASTQAAGPQGPTAELAELSDGECPDMSGTSTFSSGGERRKVRIVTPKDVTADMPVIFSFHGLTEAGTNPIDLVADGFDLKGLANELGAVFVVPEARELELPGFGALLLWGILDDADADLALYDDLRTCLSRDLDVDLTRVHAWGHSGGALWTSVLAIERADTLASFVEFSGGAEITIPLLGGPYIRYATQARIPPGLLVTGGANDVWPDTTFTMIDFEAATDILQSNLVDDGATVVRCGHDLGHFTFPQEHWLLGIDWMATHTFTGASPWAGGNDLPDGCSLQ